MKQSMTLLLTILGVIVLAQSKSILVESEDVLLGGAEELEADNSVDLEEELIGSDIKLAPGGGNPWGRKWKNGLSSPPLSVSPTSSSPSTFSLHLCSLCSFS